MHFMHVFFSITLSINSQKRLDPSNKIMKSQDKKFIVVILTSVPNQKSIFLQIFENQFI